MCLKKYDLKYGRQFSYNPMKKMTAAIPVESVSPQH